MVSKIEKEKQAERLKGWILGLINGIDPKMLVGMIKAKEIPALWEYKLPRYLSFVKDLMIEYKDDIIEQLNIDTVMEYAKEYRPDLAKILVHERAKEWMTRFLNKCRFMFRNIELEPYEIQVKYEERIREILTKREATQAEKVATILEREQEELELVARMKAKKIEAKRLKRQEERERITHEREVRVEEQRQRRLKRREEGEAKRKPKVEKEPQIEVIPEGEVEELLAKQEAEEQPVESDDIESDLFDALGKNVSDDKYDFL